MLDWLFRPSCPVELETKEWIEQRMNWLVEQFGRERMTRKKVMLPIPEHFPDPYDGGKESVGHLLTRVSQHMGIERNRLRLDFYSEADRPQLVDQSGQSLGGTAGLYEEGKKKSTIWIEVSQLHDPVAVVSTIAHELGHVLLLGEKRLTSAEEDHELVTDLLTVFLGMGVFTANATIHEHYWTSGQMTGWSIGRRGYMDQRMYGYALALFAHARREENPVWAKHLRLDVRSAFKKGLRYIRQTGDTKFNPDSA